MGHAQPVLCKPYCKGRGVKKIDMKQYGRGDGRQCHPSRTCTQAAARRHPALCDRPWSTTKISESGPKGAGGRVFLKLTRCTSSFITLFETRQSRTRSPHPLLAPLPHRQPSSNSAHKATPKGPLSLAPWPPHRLPRPLTVPLHLGGGSLCPARRGRHTTGGHRRPGLPPGRQGGRAGHRKAGV